MKGATLGFSFLTLLFLIYAVLVHMGIYIDILIDSHTNFNPVVYSGLSISVVLLNASIAYGLKRQKLWAIILGSIEMLLLIIVAGANIVLGNLFTITGSLYSSIIASLFLLALKAEYNEIKRQQESHA